MRRFTISTLTILLWTAAVVLAGVALMRGWRPFQPATANVAAAPGLPVLAAPAPARHVPYYLERETRAKDEPGRVISRKIYGLRSDGSFVEQYILVKATGSRVTRRIRFALGPTWITDDVRQQRVDRPSGPVTANMFRDPSTDCLKTYGGESAKEEKIVGRGRVGQFATIQIVDGNGASVSYANGLSCAVLARRTADLEDAAVVITAGEPPATLFQIAPEYHVVSPEQLGKPEVRK